MEVASAVLIGALLLGDPLTPLDSDTLAIAQNRGPAPTPAPVARILGSNDDAREEGTLVKRITDELDARLRRIEQRVRTDERLRQAGAIVGLGAAAIGAIRGDNPLTFIGTHALRIAFDPQLSRLRARTGMTVETSVGYRRVAITFSRTFE